MEEPANTTALVETIVPSPSSAGASGSRFAVDRGESVGCFPTTACSSTFTPSPRTVPSCTTAVGWTEASATQGLRQAVERTHDGEPVQRLAVLTRALRDEREKMLDLEPQRLVVRDLRAEDVSRASAPLAVRFRRLPGRLLVDGHLALQLHVVEDRHLLPADDGHLPHLV